MTGHCSCCEGNEKLLHEAERAVTALKADVVGLKDRVEDLRSEVKDLEQDKAALNREVDDAQGATDDAEESRDTACDARDLALDAIRLWKRGQLVLLRRLEFSLHGLCPLCFGIVEHKTGCDLKLAIWHLDHELNRTEYVHL